MEISFDRMKAVIVKAFKQDYVKFDGRVSKNDFWNFFIGLLAVGVALGILTGALGRAGQIISGLYSLAILLPSLGMYIRRCHDTDKSGMYVLISFIPCIGTILLLMQCWKEGNPAENEYGPVPEDTTEMPA